MQVSNGRQGRILVPLVHDGVCGVQAPDEAERVAFGAVETVAFRPNIAKARPTAGTIVDLDGTELRIAAIEASVAGLYRVVLAPCS